MYVEVLECESVHSTILPPKLLDTNMKSCRSEENLTLNSNNSVNSSQLNLQAFATQQQQQQQQQAFTNTSPNSPNLAENTTLAWHKSTTPKTNGNYLNIYNDNQSDCWSIHSDSGLTLHSVPQANFKFKSANLPEMNINSNNGKCLSMVLTYRHVKDDLKTLPSKIYLNRVPKPFPQKFNIYIY